MAYGQNTPSCDPLNNDEFQSDSISKACGQESLEECAGCVMSVRGVSLEGMCIGFKVDLI